MNRAEITVPGKGHLLGPALFLGEGSLIRNSGVWQELSYVAQPKTDCTSQ